MREADIYQVDAFTDVLFGGNPAGVVPDATGVSDDTMGKIAREMNLSETAFVVDTRGKGPADFEVRFFTPLSEVDLCGHATIGAFWLLAEMGLIKPSEDEVRVTQSTKAGILPVDILFGCEGVPARVMMTQAQPKSLGEINSEETSELEKILGAPEGSILEFVDARPQIMSTGLPDLITPVTSREALLSMRPNMAALTDFCNQRKIISVHCFSMETMDPAATVHCRDFSPAVGVPEESATGTASGATGAYLIMNGLVPIQGPVTRIICEQGHILGRPSSIHVEVTTEDPENPASVNGVRVGGSAVTVIRGKIKVP